MNESLIKLPPQHYVTLKSQDERENPSRVPLGFLVPDGTDTAAEKRKSTADSWAKGSYWGSDGEVHDSSLDPITVQNIPLSGFKIQHLVSRYRYSSTVPWRILDPRGFELEIYSGNMETIIAECTIINGEIQGELIWGREGANNILIPVDTQDYKDAVENQNRSTKRISLRNIEIGNKVTLQNGRDGIYLGSFFKIDYSDRWNRSNDYSVTYSKSKKHWFYDEDEFGFYSYSSPKISAIIDPTTMTVDEVEKYIETLFWAKDTVFYNDSNIGIIFNKPPKPNNKYHFEKIDIEEAKAIINDSQSYIRTIVLCETNTGHGLFEKGRHWSDDSYTYTSVALTQNGMAQSGKTLEIDRTSAESDINFNGSFQIPYIELVSPKTKNTLKFPLRT